MTRLRRFLPLAIVVTTVPFLVPATAAASTYAIAQLAIGSTLTIAATPPAITVGDAVSIDGTLAFDDASSAGGQTVSITRTDASGDQALGDVVTDVDGAYQLSDQPTVGGDAEYTATFAGAGDYQPVSASDVVSVAKRASSVSVKVSDRVVTFGHAVKVTGHLGGGTDARVLSIYAKPDGGSQGLLKRAKVDAHGNLMVSFTPGRDTTFIARFDGDPGHRSSQDSAVTRVRVIVTAKLVNYVSTSGAYRIYRAGTRARCETHVAPNHQGFGVRFTLQVHKSAGWRTVDTGTFKLNSASDVVALVAGSTRVNWRVRAQLPTHADHIGDTSPWMYLRFA
jgi:hypothetical protein